MSLLNFENTTQNQNGMVEFNAIYTLEPNIILQKLIKEEMSKSKRSFSRLTTPSLSIKRGTVLAFFGIITLFSAVAYFFYYSVIICLLVAASAMILCILILRKLTITNEIQKKAINHPDMDIYTMIHDMAEHSQTVTVPLPMKFILTGLVALIIPSIIFYQPQIIYSSYQNGYAVARYTKGIMNPEDVTIPSTYKDKPVLAIESAAFENSVMKNITLPQSIKRIGGEAFYNARHLEQITIPANVTEIKGNTFENCQNLKAVYLSEYTTSIRGSAFKNCMSLTTITLPETLTYLGAEAFSYCYALKQITIPENITEINGLTFAYCTSLEQITMHDGITSIHGETFTGCRSLNHVVLPSNITEVKGNTFENCTSLTSIEIPEGVTRIGGHAFYGCSSLAEVSIPSTMREIGSSAFRCCDSLYEIRVPAETSIDERAFKESPTTIERY